MKLSIRGWVFLSFILVVSVSAVRVGETSIYSDKSSLLGDRQSLITDSASKYESIYTDQNTVLYKQPDGTWQAGLRCGTAHPLPEEAQRIREDFSRLSKNLSAARQLLTTETPVTIPVAFHVVRHDDGTKDVTDTQIQNQLDVLNAAYESHGFQFSHHSTERTDNTTWSTHSMGSDQESAMKNALAVDPAHTLNVYICDIGGGLLGYATFPWSYPEGSNLHGVVILYSSLPGGTSSPYNEGDTATHEIGHYLGLYHTFQGGCADPNDEVADTPQEADASYGCPTGQDSCPDDAGLDPIENYMDYSDDSCMIEFTAGQRTRMDSMVAAYKPGLLASSTAQECPRIILDEGFADVSTLSASGWAMVNNSDPVGSSGWFQGSTDVFNAYDGDLDDYIAANYNNTSGVGTISNWLITPVINLGEIQEVSFWTRTGSGSWPDRLEVRLSTSGTSVDVGATAASVGDFGTLLLSINPNLETSGYPQIWTNYRISSINASGSGRIAFRYHVTDGGPSGSNSDYIGIDALTICGEARVNLLPAIHLLLLNDDN